MNSRDHVESNKDAPTMTDFEDFYHDLIHTDPASRKAWLLVHFPADVSPAHQWLALIDAAVSDVRNEQRARAATPPRADGELAASLIDWALEHGYPLSRAIAHLVELRTTILAAGQPPEHLPANLQPNNVVRRALDGFAMTRPQALARAAHLRDQPLTDADYVRPGENVAEVLQTLRGTDDYQDYDRLLDIQRMLNDIEPLAKLVTDADLAAELAEWLRITAELDPVSSVVITRNGAFLVVERDRFTARFPADRCKDLEQLQDQDIYVTVAGGPTYYVTLMTLGAIDAVLRRWAQTGEAAGGRYFYTTDLIITPRPGITAMIEAIDGLVRDGEISNACQIIPKPTEIQDASD